MKHFLFLIIVCCSSASINYGQNGIKGKYLESSCNWKCKNNEEVQNFDCIGKAIGERQYVFLGEQSHGDDETFKVKIKLIDYLHTQKGFDVVLFESDVFGLNHDLITNYYSEIPIKSSLKNIYDNWTDCSAFTNYFIHNSTENENSNLKISGFDSRMDLSFSQTNLLNFLDTSLNKYGFTGFKDTIESIVNNFHLVKDLRLIVLDSLKYNKLNELIKNNILKLDSIGLQESYLYLILKNLVFNINWKRMTKAEINLSSLRDVQMAENLKWLLKNKYHGQKCIIWSANYHIANFADNLSFTNYPETMMEVLNNDLFFRNKLYTIGFTSLGGEYLNKGTVVKIPEKRKNSIETFFKKEVTFAFIERDNSGCFEKAFYGSFIGHFPQYGKWMNIFDALFYIKEMKTCDVISE